MRKENFTVKTNINYRLEKNVRPFIIVLLLIGLSINAFAQVIFVTPAGAGDHNGLSWANAKTFKEAASTNALTGEMWMEAGIYEDITSIQIVLSVYGGFNGTETQRQQRDPVQNVTLIQNFPQISLDGNISKICDGITIKNSRFGIGGKDYTTISNCIFDNCFVSCYKEFRTGIGADFTDCIFKNYYGNGSTFSVGNGSVGVERCLFKDNTNLSPFATSGGAALIGKSFFQAGLPVEFITWAIFLDCVFDNNSTPGGYGGALAFIHPSVGTIENCLFKNNSAAYGGAVYATDFFEPQNTTQSTRLYFSNNTFAGNSATNGGTAFNFRADRNPIVFVNNIVWGNTGTGSWLAPANPSSCANVFLSNNIIQESIPDCVGTGTTINTVADPLLNPDFTLSACSPAINFGQNQFTINGQVYVPIYGNFNTDLAGNPRTVSTNKDAGCYEWQGGDAVNATWYKDADNDGYSDGTTVDQCSQPAGYKLLGSLTSTDIDCNDADAGVHEPIQYYVDADHDGYGSTTTVMLCSSTPPSGPSSPSGPPSPTSPSTPTGPSSPSSPSSPTAPTWYSTNNTDCNDNDASVHEAIQYYIDADQDGYDAGTAMLCTSTAPTGYSSTTLGSDCNDNDGSVHEPILYYVDADHDGYGSTTTAMLCSSTPPTGPSSPSSPTGPSSPTSPSSPSSPSSPTASTWYSTNNTDCNDNDASVHEAVQYYVDSDGDGYGSTTAAVLCSSTAPAGYSTNSEDGNDDNQAVQGGNGFTIFVRVPAPGNILTLDGVASSGYIINVKRLITDRRGIPTSEQILFYNGVQLQNDKTLGDYNIQKEATLDLLLVPHLCNNANDVKITGTTTFCQGGNTTLFAGYGYSTYSWSTGETTSIITINTSGTFTVTLTDVEGCTATVSATTTIIPTPTPTIIGGAFCLNGSTITPNPGILDAGPGYSAYLWSYGQANTQTISINPEEVKWGAETFTVTVYTDLNGVSCPGTASVTPTLNPVQTWYLDNDDDGHYVSSIADCKSPGAGYNTTGGTEGDCNDNNASVWQSASLYIDADGDGYNRTDIYGNDIKEELCYGATMPAGYSLTTNGPDCDDTKASVNGGQALYKDADGDGYGSPRTTGIVGCPVPGWVTNGDDCDDADANVYQTVNLYVDADGDGYERGAGLQQVCIGDIIPFGYSDFTLGIDCNDNNSNVNPEATEICDGIDNNCDGQIDEGFPSITYYRDADGDGYGNPAVTTTAKCAKPSGYVTNNADCNDGNAAINPGTKWYKDADNDGYSDGTTLTQCARPTAYKLASALKAISGDCNDANAAVNPGTKWYKDADNDGYSDGTTLAQCARPAAYKLASELKAISGDCNDANAAVNPGTKWYKDADNDGYSDGATLTQCARPTGYKLASELKAISGDCNDGNAAIKPGTVEVCGNGIDENCNGQIDENCAICGNATGLTTSNITSCSAKLNWSAVISPVQWQVQFKTTKQGSKWVSVPLLAGTARSVTISSLLAKQDYNWQIMAKCGSTWTAFSSTISFKTLSGTSPSVASRSIDKAETTNSTLTLYPNPSNGKFLVELQIAEKINVNVKIQVMDIAGKVVQTATAWMSNGSIKQPVTASTAVSNGVYMVTVIVNNKTYISRLVYQK